MIVTIETEVVSSPKLIAGRIVASNSHEDLIMLPGPSSSRTDVEPTPKLGKQYFDKTLCYAPANEYAKRRIELCKTVIPVDDSPMSPPLETMLAPLPQPPTSGCSVSYHVQDTVPYENVSKKMYTSCIVCGRSVDAIKREKADDYIRRSTPRGEPAYVTAMRKEAYLNGRNAGSFFIYSTRSVAGCRLQWSNHHDISRRTKHRTRNASYILMLKLKITQSQCSIASIISQ